MFANDASSGVIDGLSTGVRYHFEVTVNAKTANGTVLEGQNFLGHLQIKSLSPEFWW